MEHLMDKIKLSNDQIHDITLKILDTINFVNYPDSQAKVDEYLKQYQSIHTYIESKFKTDLPKGPINIRHI
jgi:hypothetical protein